MNNPTIYSDGIVNSIQDSPLRVQNKILGAVKNLGGAALSVSSDSGIKTDQTSLGANGARKSFTLQNTTAGAIYVKLGSGASATDYNYEIAGNGGNAGYGGSISVPSYVGVISIHPSTNTVAYTEFE